MKRITSLLFIFLFQFSFSQQFTCGTSDEPLEKEIQRIQTLKKISVSRKTSTSITYIAVKPHLIGKDDGTGYITSGNVNDGLSELNRQFKSANIEFYFSGTSFSKYQNTHFYDGNQSSTEVADFHTENGVNNAINLYLAGTVKSLSTGEVVGGWSSMTPTFQSGNMTWINNGQLNDDKTFSHEFGHYFSLYHTFNSSNSATVTDRELVTRNSGEITPRFSANCAIKGDFLCDTPSDPRDNGDAAVNNCVYSGTVTDANGDLFIPNINNIMDYNFCSPYLFTSGQSARISDGLLIVTNANNFTLTAPETIQAAPTNLVASSNGDYAGNINLSWTDNSVVETGYIIERSASSSGPFVAVLGVEENTTSSSAPTEPGVACYFRIKASNTKANYSIVSNAVTGPQLCGNLGGQTCDLAADPNNPAQRIEQFILSKAGTELINNQNSGCSVNGIGNYFSTYSATVVPGETLGFVIKPKSLSGISLTFAFTAKIFIDWNLDNDFNDANEEVYSGSIPQNTNATGSFVVPNGISVGNIRMRIALEGSSGKTPTACSVNTGEMEDYKLINTTLSVDDYQLNDNSIAVFPNPTQGLLYFETKHGESFDKVIVLDIAGRKIMEQKNQSNQISTEKLAEGIYFLQLFSGNKKFKAKFIKQ